MEGKDQHSPGAAAPLRREWATVAALIVVFWIAFQIVFYTYGTLGGSDQDISPAALLAGIFDYMTLPVELSITAVGAALSLGVYILLQHIRRLALWKQLPIATLAALFAASCFSMAVSIICDWFGVAWPSITPRFLVADSLRWLAPFGLWAGIALTVTYNSEVRERERRLALFQAQAREAQMRALRYQVNPHLLYNTLNSIAALILDGKNELAEAMVLRLSSFFRASLSNDPHADVPLADEVALQRLYLDIEQMRFPNLTTRFDVSEDLGKVRVPSLILQPLVENVFKHGINPDGLPTHLEIRASCSGERLALEIADDGPGTSASAGTGTGISNVEGRLRSRYGEQAWLEVQSQPGKGFLVRLNMPTHCHD